jgi:hypothetical protein
MAAKQILLIFTHDDEISILLTPPGVTEDLLTKAVAAGPHLEASIVLGLISEGNASLDALQALPL